MLKLFLLISSVILAIPLTAMDENVTEGSEELRLLVLGEERHCGYFTAFAISYDDALIAAALNSQIYIWHLNEGSNLVEINIGKYVGCMDFSKDGRLVTIANDGLVEFWNCTSGVKIDDLKIEGGAVALKFCPDDQHLLIISLSRLVFNEKSIEIWSICEKKIVKKNAYFYGIKNIDFSPNGEEFVVSCYDTNSLKLNNYVLIYSLEDLSVKRSFACSHAGFSASFGADGQEVLVKFDYKDVKILSGDPLGEKFSLNTDVEIIASGFDRSKSRIFLVHNNKTITEWQGQSMIKTWSWPAETSTIFMRKILFSPNGNFMLTWVDGENIQLWQWPQKRRVPVKKAHH